ncbi:hypothetical protein [Nocardioides montaniterrae]
MSRRSRALSILLALAPSALVLAGCGGASDGAAPHAGGSDLPQEKCTTHPEVTKDGFTVPGSVLCLGTTATVPYRDTSNQPILRAKLTVTAVEESTDASFAPSALPDGFKGGTVWVVRYQSTMDGHAEMPTAPFAPLSVLWVEGGATSGKMLEQPDDCAPDPSGANGCAWDDVEDGGVVHGAQWVSLDDPRWSMDSPIRWGQGGE